MEFDLLCVKDGSIEAAYLSKEESVSLISQSAYFDRDWYLRAYPDVSENKVDPAEHYVSCGAAEGRDPGPAFQTRWYMLAYADVGVGGVNPLIHFMILGSPAGRLPKPPYGLSMENVLELVRQSGFFDEAWFLKACPDAGRLRRDPLEYYFLRGVSEGWNPSRQFHTLWYLREYQDVAQNGMNPLLHFVLFGRQEGRLGMQDLPQHLDADAVATVASSRYFDHGYYLHNNPDIAQSGIDPLIHFCLQGYRELRNPSPGFDLLWYQQNYLRSAGCDTNPLVHYEKLGKANGCLPKPPKKHLNATGQGLVYSSSCKTAIRRACLFAGYDAHGIVDAYVIEYIRELSRYADVFYLSDCEMQPHELDKIKPFVKGAWAHRHGMYDFGSYSKLAKDLVGWDRLGSYDEVMFVNDSCYCLRSLSHVFEKMDSTQCDWWGLQATKGIWDTRDRPSNAFADKIPVWQVKSEMLDKFEEDYTYDFLIGSYFLVVRKPVMRNSAFRELLDSVETQQSKKQIILRYEVGLTRFLIQCGYEFATFIDDLYPLHPVYSLSHFELIRRGFPLLKRFLLTDNHYKVPGLGQWKALLNDALPGVKVESIEENLRRVADQEKLYRSLNVGVNAAGERCMPPLLDKKAFSAEDAATEKRDDWWVFPVCGYNHTLAGNERAVFEAVKDDPRIKKIILHRSKYIDVDGQNVEVVPLNSLEGQRYLIKAKVAFIKHTPSRNLGIDVDACSRHLINLWHGIPLKRIGYASLDQKENLARLYAEHQRCRAVISSSRVDQLAMASAFYPLSYNDVWVTGLPRNDFVVRSQRQLPADMQKEVVRIREVLSGRKLVLFAPTFRNAQEGSYYSFSRSELSMLSRLLNRHNAVLGVREHLADKDRSYSKQLSEIGAVCLDDSIYPNIESIFHCASVLLTDYSSCFFDFLLTGKPVVSFAYDYDRYVGSERGMFYDMQSVFPGPICRDAASLIGALEAALGAPSSLINHKYEYCRRLFFDFQDDKSSARVVKKVQELLGW